MYKWVRVTSLLRPFVAHLEDVVTHLAKFVTHLAKFVALFDLIRAHGSEAEQARGIDWRSRTEPSIGLNPEPDKLWSTSTFSSTHRE